jgi:hypothetical protein
MFKDGFVINARQPSWLVLLFAVAISAKAADGPLAIRVQDQSPCPECVEHRCQVVPVTKQIKKTVYEVKEAPFCIKKLPPLWSLFHDRGCSGETCADCQCPRYRKVLVQKEIVCKEICTTKCVVEERRVPCQPCECGK